MTLVTISGYSDDVACVSVDGKDDEIGCYSKPCVIDVLTPKGNGVRVILTYAEYNATWGIEVLAYSINEGDPELPDWNFSFSRSDRKYSPMLTINTGEETVNAFSDDLG